MSPGGFASRLLTQLVRVLSKLVGGPQISLQKHPMLMHSSVSCRSVLAELGHLANLSLGAPKLLVERQVKLDWYKYIETASC